MRIGPPFVHRHSISCGLAKQARIPRLTSSRLLYQQRLISGIWGIDSGMDFTYISNVGASPHPPRYAPPRDRKDSEEKPQKRSPMINMPILTWILLGLIAGLLEARS